MKMLVQQQQLMMMMLKGIKKQSTEKVGKREKETMII
jgi:hypothetical protein